MSERRSRPKRIRKRLNGAGNGANGSAHPVLAVKQSRSAKKARAKERERSRRRRRAKWQLQHKERKDVLTLLGSGDFPDTRPVTALCKLGLTDDQIGEVLGVSSATFERWKVRSPRLRAAIQRGRRIADTHVAESMYMQALGFSVPEEKIFYNSRSDKVRRVYTNKYYPPSTLAGIFWLKNRFADYWRDKKEVEVEGGGANYSSIKFVLVQSGAQAGQGQQGRGEKVIDADFKVLPGAGREGRGGE